MTNMNKTNLKNMLLAGLFVLVGAAGFTACSDSDDDKGKTPETPTKPEEKTPVTTFDDLDFFQNAIIRVDSLGQFVERRYGEPLYENDTTHVYIGVENLEEARKLFNLWLAPDVKTTTQTPTTTDVTATLTDEEGKVQGEVYFKAGTEGADIAEVTTTASVRHFRKISFIPNSAWPHNAQEGKYVKGDIIETSYRSHIHSFKVQYRTMKMVCVRSQGNGICPMFVGITKNKHEFHAFDDDSRIYDSLGEPTTDLIHQADAITVSKCLREDWDLFAGIFANAGEGPLLKDEYYWINEYALYVVYAELRGMRLWDGDTYDFDIAWATPAHYALYLKTTGIYLKYNPVQYVERSWDNETKTVKEEEKTLEGYYPLMGNNEDFRDIEGQWNVVTEDVSFNVLNISGTGNHLVICDGAKLKLKHLDLPEGAELTIHGGPKGTGILEVDNREAPDHKDINYKDAAGIGGLQDKTMGTLIVQGANITAYGYARAAAIGGGDAGHGGTFIMYGGEVTAYGGEDAAGIGGGEDGRGANITIYGGKIAASARLVSASVGAAIGGGQDAGGGIFTMYGGDVYAEGGVNAAGIGGGEDGTSGPITIYGGKVRAYGGKSGAGIGSGFAANCNTVTIYGGDVEAHGGLNAAGIGSGEEGKTSNINSGTIDIRGGKVYAVGDGYGAGIGAGREATCGTIGIAGGRVDAHAGSACGPWSGGIGSYHSEHEDGCHIGWAGWQRIYIGACMRLWTYSPSIGVIENVHYTENWWNFTHQRPQVAYGECNHVDGAYDITNCPYCHSYTLMLQ